MNFWDASAIVPLCVEDPASEVVRRIATKDSSVVIWWGTAVECWSAFARARREGELSLASEERARAALDVLRQSWDEVQPIEDLRSTAGRLVRVHPLRAADALQLAAALTWASNRRGVGFVCLDKRLGEAARLEGFAVFPEETG